MNRKKFFISTALAAMAVIIFNGSVVSQTKDIVGDWTGNATFNTNSIPMDMHFSLDAEGSLIGTIDVQTGKGFKLDSISYEAGTLTCTATLGNTSIEFTGALSSDGNGISGTFSQGQSNGSFELTRGLRPVAFADEMVTIEQLATAWKGMADYTIEMAEMMPEDKYSYKPVDVLRNWAEQCNHVTSSNNFFANSLFGTPAQPPVTVTEKTDVIAAMKKSFDAVLEGLNGWTAKDAHEVLANGKTKFQVFLFMTDHLTHTRGIMIMYLRMNGMAPPQFRTY